MTRRARMADLSFDPKVACAACGSFTDESMFRCLLCLATALFPNDHRHPSEARTSINLSMLHEVPVGPQLNPLIPWK
jgi:hypothetical protein